MSDEPDPASLDELKALLLGLRDGSAGLRAEMAGLRTDLMAGMDRLDATATEIREMSRRERERQAEWEAQMTALGPALRQDGGPA